MLRRDQVSALDPAGVDNRSHKVFNTDEFLKFTHATFAKTYVRKNWKWEKKLIMAMDKHFEEKTEELVTRRNYLLQKEEMLPTLEVMLDKVWEIEKELQDRNISDHVLAKYLITWGDTVNMISESLEMLAPDVAEGRPMTADQVFSPFAIKEEDIIKEVQAELAEERMQRLRLA